MSVGIGRRLISFLLDALPILLIVSLLFNFLAADLLKDEGYDVLTTEYTEYNDEYFNAIEPYRTHLDDGEIDQDEYVELVQPYYDTFAEATVDHRAAIVTYSIRAIVYHIATFSLLYYVYNGVLKGVTLGRRMMGIELGGKITWWTLFVREIIYKVLYWLFTLLLIGILIDIGMILFSKRKKTLRDYVSNTYIKFIGVDYPF